MRNSILRPSRKQLLSHKAENHYLKWPLPKISNYKPQILRIHPKSYISAVKSNNISYFAFELQAHDKGDGFFISPSRLIAKDKRDMNANPVNIGTRLASMVLDHVIMSLLIGFFVAPFTAASATTATSGKLPTPAELLGTGQALYAMLIGMSIYLCKDCIGGRSLAKRITKLQVVDNKTYTPATPLQCLLRNFSIVFWPIEVLIVLFSPGRRLGDRLAGTRVVPFNKEVQPSTTNYLQVAICLLLGFAYLFLITKPLQ